MAPRRPVRDVAPADLTALDFDTLRAYRQELRAEEDRISYWRRVVQGRLDLLRAGQSGDTPLDLNRLARALGDTGTGGTRQAFLRLTSADPLPELPALRGEWAHGGDDQTTIDALTDAETRLSEYRTALHRRLDAATNELVDRYRQQPWLALRLLPEPSPLIAGEQASEPTIPFVQRNRPRPTPDRVTHVKEQE